MGLLAQLLGNEHNYTYSCSIGDGPWSEIDEIARPFFNKCKAYGFQLASEPRMYPFFEFSFTNDSRGQIQLSRDYGFFKIAIFRTYTKEDYVSEPDFRETVKQIFEATIEELLYQNPGHYGYSSDISDNSVMVTHNWIDIKAPPSASYM